MTTDRENDLPEGVINAFLPGGWESEESADAEIAAQSAEAEGSEQLTESGLAPDGPIESAVGGQGADPDLNTTEESR